MHPIKSISEIHSILIKILQEFHKICEANDIPYYLVYGTMLGAKRHKGFIPWDDDVDVAIEFKYYNKLVNCLKNELPERYKVITRYDKKGVPAGYLKIEDTNTLLIESWTKREKCTGVFIDVFLLYPSDGKTNLFSRYTIIKCLRYIQVNRFYKINKSKISDIIIKSIIKSIFFWIKPYYYANIIERYLIPHNGNYYCTYATIYNKKDIISKDIFGSPTLVEFEGIYFCGIENSDAYLRHMYGEYNVLPSPENRRVHISEAYYI